ncbi:MAG TPA: hypothetical protein VHG90_07625 [Acidimicrobiales bacterium]|nr:hypothetical protein [Acidimicrobiales bacterium]
MKPIYWQQGSNDGTSTKRPQSDAELGFVRRPMVRWFDPHQLVDTLARVVASGVWNSYADSRDLQALTPSDVYDRSESSELWVGYVSDLGDGFDSTYTVARALAQEKLNLSFNDDHVATERGRILVMGGDQVYPVPKRAEYQNRLIGPYRAALPHPSGATPELFAIPGSHDWYDGLINFSNIFCRVRPIGGWKTTQARSYFAIKLPHGWWLWGIDVQFADYLDEAQIQYFRAAGEELDQGDQIVLCMAKEVDSGRKSTEVFSDRDVGYLEREVVEPADARVALYLKSGRHHYSRYEEEGGPCQLITAGGGGAFMHPTHALPERTRPHGNEDSGEFKKAAVYPSASDSKRLRKWLFVLPVYNLPLAAFFGGIYVVLAFMLNLHLRSAHVSLGLTDLRRALWNSPTAFMLIMLMVVTFGIMVRLAHEASSPARLLIGLVHTAMLFATLTGVFIGSSRLASLFGDGADSLLAFLGFVAVLGGVSGVLGISAYLWATNLLGFHGNEAYAPLHYMHYKNFLRLYIADDGDLTVYPVGIDKVTKKWQSTPDAGDDAPWFAPVGDEPELRLIEAPITIRKRPPEG